MTPADSFRVNIGDIQIRVVIASVACTFVLRTNGKLARLVMVPATLFGVYTSGIQVRVVMVSEACGFSLHSQSLISVVFII